MATYLFDLDMTLVDTSAVAQLRRVGFWQQVKASMHLLRPYPKMGTLAPHELPGKLRELGHVVGVVTSSPRWYATDVLTQFRIPHDVLVAYEDTAAHKPDPEPIQEALRRLPPRPGDLVFYVGDDVVDIEAAYHAGVTSVGISWGPVHPYELSTAAPDLFITRPQTLLSRAEESARLGYAAEVALSAHAIVWHGGSILPCGHEPAVYALGRYFTTADPRHATSRLSFGLLDLKNSDGLAPTIGHAVGKAIARLDWQPRYIVPVPPKPSQQRNRFEAILQHAHPHLLQGTDVMLDGLKCTKEITDYKTKGPLDRAASIRGAFKTGYERNGLSI